ncbi:MarR family transcriptional regulator [Amycolatopsis sp. NEAU-NG30]|uniref:MarR family transcriptional regulator n=1 Tax=Amycolatopsis melonis TaxID=3156488 RepID=A0ABV0LPK6_9PSEU
MTREEEPIGPDAPNRLIWALRRAELAARAVKEQQLRPLGLAPAHYSLLMIVHTEPGLTGAELARRLDVTPQAVASLVTRLVDKGQLERRAHARHRHVQELHLTATGRQVLKSADTVIAAIERQITERLGTDSATRLTRLLEETIDAVREIKA